MNVVQTPIRDIIPTLAQLYGAPEEAMEWLSDLTPHGWLARSPRGEILGAVLGRPATPHGSELMGGALPGVPGAAQGGSSQAPVSTVSTALVHAAHAALGPVYAFGEPHLFPETVLLAAGFERVGLYRRLAGATPDLHAGVPPGLTLRSLREVTDLTVRVQAMETYADQIGHHGVTAQAAASDFGGAQPDLSFIALDEQGRGVGICCVQLEGDQGLLGAPGIAPAWRSSGLRDALYAQVFAGLRQRGVSQVSVDSWGDSPADLAHDLGLGLTVAEETPILALA